MRVWNRAAFATEIRGDLKRLNFGGLRPSIYDQIHPRLMEHYRNRLLDCMINAPGLKGCVCACASAQTWACACRFVLSRTLLAAGHGWQSPGLVLRRILVIVYFRATVVSLPGCPHKRSSSSSSIPGDRRPQLIPCNHASRQVISPPKLMKVN